MPLTLRFQTTGKVPSSAGPVRMAGSNLTVGRAEGNDLILPDPDRTISKRHCVLEERGGQIMVIDISSNGTFLNYAKKPLGRTPVAINDGDILSVGPYELLIDLSHPSVTQTPQAGVPQPSPLDDIPPPLGEDMPGGGDLLDDLLGPPAGGGPLIPDDADDDLLGPLGSSPALGGASRAGGPLEGPGFGDGDLLGPLDPFPAAPPQGSGPPSSPLDDFAIPAKRQELIPEDWDADFLAPGPAPVSTPPPAADGPPDPLAPLAEPIPEALPNAPSTPGVSAPPPTAPAPTAPPPGAALRPIGDDPSAGRVFGGQPTRPGQGVDPAFDGSAAAPGLGGQTPGPGLTGETSGPGLDSQAPGGDLGRQAAQSGAGRDAPRADLSGDASPANAAPAPPPFAAPPTPATPPRQAAQPAAPTSDAAEAFLAALGVEKEAAGDLDQALSRMGGLTRIMIAGLRDILMTRTAIKGEFRMSQTVIRAEGNNPLKFSITEDQAVESLLRPPARGYMPPEQAVTEALDDIRAHEVAMVTGMQAALKGLLARLDPETLVQRLEESGGARGGFFKAKKSQYWEIYEKAYADISKQAENDFQDLFQNEFAKAYQQQLENLK